MTGGPGSAGCGTAPWAAIVLWLRSRSAGCRGQLGLATSSGGTHRSDARVCGWWRYAPPRSDVDARGRDARRSETLLLLHRVRVQHRRGTEAVRVRASSGRAHGRQRGGAWRARGWQCGERCARATAPSPESSSLTLLSPCLCAQPPWRSGASSPPRRSARRARRRRASALSRARSR